MSTEEPTHDLVVITTGGDEFCIPLSRGDWSTEQVARDVALRCKGDAAALYGMTENDSPHGQVGVAIPVHAIAHVIVRGRRRGDVPTTEAGTVTEPAERLHDAPAAEAAEAVPVQADAQYSDAHDAADIGQAHPAR